MIRNFDEFCTQLLADGFSMGGGNAKGIHAVIPYDWKEQQLLDVPVRWHTGNPETDPWEWRMRVLEERCDIAYAKVFFRTSGYITKQWYPYFYAVRRRGRCFEEAYADGLFTAEAKTIYEIVSEGETAMHEIRQFGGFHTRDNAGFERALLDLQMDMYITMSGRAQKINRHGEAYGWSSTVFTTTEAFWMQRGLTIPECDACKSRERIREQILRLNPAASPRRIDAFIGAAR